MPVEVHQVAWLIFGCGLFLLAWAGFDMMMGRTRVDRAFALSEVVDRDAEPERFRRTIIACLIAAFFCLSFGGYLLVIG